MALDYLTIQGAATTVERVWSSASDTDTKKRNRHSPTRLEALQVLKKTFRDKREKALTPAQKELLRKERLRVIDNDCFQDPIFEDSDNITIVLDALGDSQGPIDVDELMSAA